MGVVFAAKGDRTLELCSLIYRLNWTPGVLGDNAIERNHFVTG